MSHHSTFTRIESGRVIAILRGDFGGREEAMVEAMIDGGLTAVEVTLNSPGAMPTIGRLADRFGEVCAVGAGTVLKPEEVLNVAEAGGRFIVSPNTDPAVIGACAHLKLVALPGAFTPTEIVAAIASGADAVKLFPAASLGPGYLKAVRGPLPDVKLIPTGGVTPELAREYRAAGAWAVGVGSELLGRGGKVDLAELRRRMAEFIAAMKG